MYALATSWAGVLQANSSEWGAIADLPLPGFRVEARFPYTSRLSGLETRYVLAQSKIDRPALPPPRPAP